MSRWITKDDWVETQEKILHRGWKYMLSKIHPNAQSRVKSTFDDEQLETANWWIIPEIKERWNEIISGQKQLHYEDYIIEKYLNHLTEGHLFSPGCGNGNHEIHFAKSGKFKEVLAIDLAEKLIQGANQKASALQLNQLQFKVASIEQITLEKDHFDMVLFHSSLHHFEQVETLLLEKIIPSLKRNGLIVIHEYVGPNRLQWKKAELLVMNQLLKEIPSVFRRRKNSGKIKQRITGPGVLRMWLTDPSEAVDSASILPALRKHMKVLEEKALGGNILMPLLKDISHHFLSQDSKELLQYLIAQEDLFLQHHESLLMFGVYQKP